MCVCIHVQFICTKSTLCLFLLLLHSIRCRRAAPSRSMRLNISRDSPSVKYGPYQYYFYPDVSFICVGAIETKVALPQTNPPRFEWKLTGHTSFVSIFPVKWYDLQQDFPSPYCHVVKITIRLRI